VLYDWQHLAQLFWEARDFRRVLGHEREWLDVEEETLGRSFCP
jgi:hypothetical protein